MSYIDRIDEGLKDQMTLNTNIENRFNLTYIYSLKDRQGEQERDTEKIERWRKKTSRVWKVSLINILSYTVGE